LADLAAASVAAEVGVGGGTHANDAQAWTQYTQYCDSIGLNGNYFLDGMPQQHKLAVMGAFAVPTREGQFSRQSDAPLAQKLVANTIHAVAATSEKTGEKTHIGTQNATLDDFYKGN
jgi:hypothetical protein